jgi:hypothetical protein
MHLSTLVTVVVTTAVAAAPARADDAIPPIAPALAPPAMPPRTTAAAPADAAAGPAADPPSEDPRARGRERARAYITARDWTDAADREATATAPGPRSARLAIGLSLGVTAAGATMMLASGLVDPASDAAELGLLGGGAALVLLGPSSGRIYLGRGQQGLLLSLGRAAGASAFFLAPWDGGIGGKTAATLGAATVLGLSIYDVATQPALARQRRGLVIVPTAGGRGDERAIGLVVAGEL